MTTAIDSMAMTLPVYRMNASKDNLKRINMPFETGGKSIKI
jgi:hypothetical protein